MRKHWRYLKYLARHKWYVFIECCKLGIPFHGVFHDLSQLLPDEWFAYAEFFYGDWLDDVSPYIQKRFNKAWLKHQRRNNHHWQHWVLRRDSGESIPVDIPKNVILHMIADWRGAGRAMQGYDDSKMYYHNRKRIMILTEKTRAAIEWRLRYNERDL